MRQPAGCYVCAAPFDVGTVRDEYGYRCAGCVNGHQYQSFPGQLQGIQQTSKNLDLLKKINIQKELESLKYDDKLKQWTVAPLYNKLPAAVTDRPTLAQRLDAMEEKYKTELAFKRQLEHDYGILHDKYTKLERDNKVACERVVYASGRLKGLDLMGADLQKLRTAIGAKAYNEIINAKDETCAAPF